MPAVPKSQGSAILKARKLAEAGRGGRSEGDRPGRETLCRLAKRPWPGLRLGPEDRAAQLLCCSGGDS